MGHAAALFNGAREQTLQKRVTPSAEQREFLQTQWNALADHLKSALTEKYGYTVSTWLQGSYKYGTLLRPVHLKDEYDVDVGIYFEWDDDGNAAPSPLQLRDWVQRELVAYKRLCANVQKVEEPAKARCSRAVYERQFHIDTPVYHLERRRDRRKLACLSGEWEESDPKAFYKWFKGAVSDSEREQVRRLIRYLKGWAVVAFESAPAARPSSVLLTVLVTDAFNAQWSTLLVTPDDELLTWIIKKIHDRLWRNKVVPNPVDKRENLNRISDDEWDVFMSRLQTLRDAAEHAEDASDESSAALAWSEAFSYLMPLPLAESVQVLDASTERALLQVPDILIDVLRQSDGQSVATHQNEVPSVAKGRKLKFRIRNPALIPEFASVEWTVRNEGDESDSIGDLGHRKVGIRLTDNEEHTAYAGLHYVDCIVRIHGQVYAMRRVPVNVLDLGSPPRNPKKPSYVRITSKLRRR